MPEFLTELARVRIVLVGPETAGNVGSAARALRVMGLAQLVLVAPECDPHDAEAVRLASGATDVLSRVRVVDSLAEALAGTIYSVATTRRVRRQRAPFFTPEQSAAEALRRLRGSTLAGAAGEVAFVFGRESKGLSNPELEQCTALSSIPQASDEQSLNLAQAVMLYAAALYQAGLPPGEGEYRWNYATHEQLERLYAELGRTILHLGLKPATTLDRFLARCRRVFGRASWEPRDIHLLLKLLKLMQGR